MEVNDYFKAKVDSLENTFGTDGQKGFIIPLYQRKYDWGEENVLQLFEDVVSGLVGCDYENQLVTFLGTIILVNDNDSRDEYNGKSFHIVDGQQRLTTLALIFCHLIHESKKAWVECRSEFEDEETKAWLLDELDCVVEALRHCILGSWSSLIKKRKPNASEHYPKLIRQGKNVDYRGRENYQYYSNIAKYLYDFGKQVVEDSLGDRIAFSPIREDDDYQAFVHNIEVIKKIINKLLECEEPWDADFGMPNAASLIHRDYLWLFDGARFFYVDRSQDEGIDQAKAEKAREAIENNDQALKLLRLLALSNYFLKNVALARVEVKENSYAFDIFEALNTTGEPLTAIETFKPDVIHYEEKNRKGVGYEGSESQRYFIEIDDYLDKFRASKTRQSESKKISIDFALLLTGEKLDGNTRSHRNYFRKRYASLLFPTEQDKEKLLRVEFIKVLHLLLEFRQKFWANKDIETTPYYGEDRDEVLFFLHLFREINQTLVIPILARAWAVGKEDERNDYSYFAGVVKALGSFTIIRRCATGDTASIDNDFRAIMQKGGRLRNQGLDLPMKHWSVDSSHRYDKNIDCLPSIEEFKKILLSYLLQPRVRISKNNNSELDSEMWIKRFSNRDIYKYPQIAKASLLVAFHNASYSKERGKEWQLIKGRGDPQQKNYFNYSSWSRSAFRTIEHVAPQSRKEKTDWDIRLWDNPDSVNTIGNLTLLPDVENAEASNHSWSKKSLLYSAFVCETEAEVERVISNANKLGENFSNKTIQYLKSEESRRLAHLQGLIKVEKWNLDLVMKRGRNIAGAMWQEIESRGYLF